MSWLDPHPSGHVWQVVLFLEKGFHKNPAASMTATGNMSLRSKPEREPVVWQVWRRWRDSNSRAGLTRPTPLAGEPRHQLGYISTVAESQGFEPWKPCGLPVFKTGAIDHSANFPHPQRAFYHNFTALSSNSRRFSKNLERVGKGAARLANSGEKGRVFLSEQT